MIKKNKKPTGGKSYGSIPHLPNSRLGPSDRNIGEGMANICTDKTRDFHDLVIVQEKLDGSNVGVAKVDGCIVSLSRAGYEARTSPFLQHHLFADWVDGNISRFDDILNEGERICGEWLALAHGTKYKLEHEPFVVFDLFRCGERILFDELANLCDVHGFTRPYVISIARCPMSVNEALSRLGKFGFHGATEEVEGAVWRVERNGKVDFLAKYVKPSKIDGKYFGDVDVWNDGLEDYINENNFKKSFKNHLT